MAIVISGNGIDMGNNPVSNASQIDGTVINENGSNVRTENDSYSKTEVDGKIVGFKNYIINGNFNIWQRGTSFTGLTNTTYSADRWVLFGSVGNESYNVIRNASTAFSGGYSGVFTITGGTGVKAIMQWVEDFTRFNVGDVYTLSFEAYTNSTPYNITPALQCVNGVWASSSAESSNGTVTITNTKQRFSVQLTIPDWTGLSFNWALLNYTRLAVKLNIGSEVPLNSNFIISNVQLEKGSVATPFEQRPYGLELSLCERYFRSNREYIGSGTYNGRVTTSYGFGTSMRVTPTLSNSNATPGFGTISEIYPSIYSLTFAGNGNSQGQLAMSTALDAEL